MPIKSEILPIDPGPKNKIYIFNRLETHIKIRDESAKNTV
jgi:hypothetical protein